MHTIRKYLSWVFAVTSLICAQVVFTHAAETVHQLTADQYLRFRFLLLLLPSMMIAFAAIFGMAWWTTFKEKRSSRWWGIAASIINIKVSLLPIFIPPHSIWNTFSLVLVLGIVGLVAFVMPVQPLEKPGDKVIAQPHLGDGTNALLNKLLYLLMFGIGYAAYEWWHFWLVSKGISRVDNSWYETIANLLILFFIAVTHEFGHAAAGLILGMKLRAFVVGPFQWRIFDGKWEFRFVPKQILIAGGSASVVPTSMQYRRSHHLWVASAGVLANVVTGGLAMLLTEYAKGSSPIQLGGLLGLFGLWSLFVAPMNLVPFRVGSSYSDGAQIYQLLSNGPWADLQHVFSIAASTLTTPLRPRDYDVAAIQRAANAVTRGWHGLLLRLFAYNYFFDHGRMSEAADEIRQAALIYNAGPEQIGGELLTGFVFCSAYVCRDASAARQWWSHLDAKKPVRLGVDYWLASSALHWVEGDLKTASEALERAQSLAQCLPKAGSYDFDRDCCLLLRHALDEVPVTT